MFFGIFSVGRKHGILGAANWIYGGVFCEHITTRESSRLRSIEKYISEFDDIPEALKDKRVEEVDRTPAENLAYQVGWTTLVLKWETDERNGLPLKTPSEDFKWCGIRNETT